MVASTSDPLAVCVAGATGFIGRHIVRALLDRGHAVRALVRHPSKARKVLGEHAGLTLHDGDACDGAGLEEWAARADAMVNAIGIVREGPGGQTFQRVHVGVVRHLLGAAAAGGVRHVLLISALGVRDEADTGYDRSKFEGEMLVRNSGIDWTILRPSLVHGPEGELSNMAVAWARGRAAPYVFMPYFSRPVKGKGLKPTFESPVVAPIHVDDVALATALALERPGCRGEVIALCGPERLSWPEMLGHIRDHVRSSKRHLKAVGIPWPVAVAKAKAARAVGLRDALPFDEGMARLGAKDAVCPMSRAEALLGLKPAGFRESAGYLAAM
jgi:NADH dehydrogenase